jgi:hypothetical protein
LLRQKTEKTASRFYANIPSGAEGEGELSGQLMLLTRLKTGLFKTEARHASTVQMYLVCKIRFYDIALHINVWNLVIPCYGNSVRISVS